VQVTWVGHATIAIDVGDIRIVTDPALTGRIAHLRRRVPEVDLGSVDAVLISHVHMDHLHGRSLRQVSSGARLIAPRGARPLLTGCGFASIDDVARGDIIEHRGIRIEVVHAEHGHGRGPHSRVTATPVGYVIEAGGVRIYFPGDTDLHPQMHELGHIDLALLPIWGTYSPVRVGRGSPTWLDRPIHAFRERLDLVGLADRLVGLDPGGSLLIDATGAHPAHS
jgi:L-ascorbate metabolism protein UlaG (beta-lactamase superfamily)